MNNNKKIVISIVLFVVLFALTRFAFAWTEKTFVAEWDGSTVWSSDMPIDSPGVPTGDHKISTWDNDLLMSEQVQMCFAYGRCIQVGLIMKEGKVKYFTIMPQFARIRNIDGIKEILTDIADKIYKEFFVCASI